MKKQFASIGLLLLSFSFIVGSCKGELQGEAPKKAKTKKKSNVIEKKRAVPLGKQLDCNTVFPDLTPFTTALGELHEIGSIKDRGASNSSATMVCSLIKAGEPPQSPKELKPLKAKYAKLGVLPGDEYCKITANCSTFNDEKSMREKCEKEGNSAATLQGEFACVRSTPKGPEYSYTYSFIEPDTTCTMEVMAGPSVVEDAIVRACAIATRDLMTKDSLQALK